MTAKPAIARADENDEEELSARDSGASGGLSIGSGSKPSAGKDGQAKLNVAKATGQGVEVEHDGNVIKLKFPIKQNGEALAQSTASTPPIIEGMGSEPDLAGVIPFPKKQPLAPATQSGQELSGMRGLDEVSEEGGPQPKTSDQSEKKGEEKKEESENSAEQKSEDANDAASEKKPESEKEGDETEEKPEGDEPEKPSEEGVGPKKEGAPNQQPESKKPGEPESEPPGTNTGGTEGAPENPEDAIPKSEDDLDKFLDEGEGDKKEKTPEGGLDGEENKKQSPEDEAKEWEDKEWDARIRDAKAKNAAEDENKEWEDKEADAREWDARIRHAKEQNPNADERLPVAGPPLLNPDEQSAAAGDLDKNKQLPQISPEEKSAGEATAREKSPESEQKDLVPDESPTKEKKPDAEAEGGGQPGTTPPQANPEEQGRLASLLQSKKAKAEKVKKKLEEALRRAENRLAEIRNSASLKILGWFFPRVFNKISDAVNSGRNAASAPKLVILEAKVDALKVAVHSLEVAEGAGSIIDGIRATFQFALIATEAVPIIGTILVILLSPAIVLILAMIFLFIGGGAITPIMKNYKQKLKKILEPLEKELKEEKRKVKLRKMIHAINNFLADKAPAPEFLEKGNKAVPKGPSDNSAASISDKAGIGGKPSAGGAASAPAIGGTK